MKIVLVILLTALIVGGGTYWFVSNSAHTRQADLEKTVTALNANVGRLEAELTNATQPAPACLTAALTGGEGAAGTYYYTFELQNTGSTPCNYEGSATTTLLDKQNAVLGSTISITSPALTLAPSQTVYTAIGFPNPDNSVNTSDCKAGVTSLAFYPPNQKDAVKVAGVGNLKAGWTDHACSGFSTGSFSTIKR